MERKIELPEGGFSVESRGVSVTIDLKALSPDLLARALLHGLTQKIADGASAAKRVADESDDMTVKQATESMMQGVVDQLLEGDWGRTRTGGSGLTERDRVAVKIVRKWFKDHYAKGTAERDKYDGLDNEGRTTMIAGIWEGNEGVFAEAVDAELERMKAERESVKAIGGEVDIAI